MLQSFKINKINCFEQNFKTGLTKSHSRPRKKKSLIFFLIVKISLKFLEKIKTALIFPEFKKKESKFPESP